MLLVEGSHRHRLRRHHHRHRHRHQTTAVSCARALTCRTFTFCVCEFHDNDDEYLNTLLIRMVNGKFNEFRILCAIIACDAPSFYRLWITLNFQPCLTKWAPFPNKNNPLLLTIYLFIFPNCPPCIWNRAKPCDQFCLIVLSSVQFYFPVRIPCRAILITAAFFHRIILCVPAFFL